MSKRDRLNKLKRLIKLPEQDKLLIAWSEEEEAELRALYGEDMRVILYPGDENLEQNEQDCNSSKDAI